MNLERKPRSSKKAKPLQKGQTVLSNFCQIIRRSQTNEQNCTLGDPISSNNGIARKVECKGRDVKSMGNDDEPSAMELDVEHEVVQVTSIPSDRLDSLNVTTDCNIQSRVSAMVKCDVTLRRWFPHDAESADQSSTPKEIFGGDSAAAISSECEVQKSELMGHVEQPLVVEPKIVSPEPVSSDQLHDDMAQLCLTHDVQKSVKQDAGPTLPSSIPDISSDTNEDGCMTSYLDDVPIRTVAKRSILEVDDSSEITPAARKKQKVPFFSHIALEKTLLVVSSVPRQGRQICLRFKDCCWPVWAKEINSALRQTCALKYY